MVATNTLAKASNCFSFTVENSAWDLPGLVVLLARFIFLFLDLLTRWGLFARNGSMMSLLRIGFGWLTLELLVSCLADDLVAIDLVWLLVDWMAFWNLVCSRAWRVLKNLQACRLLAEWLMRTSRILMPAVTQLMHWSGSVMLVRRGQAPGSWLAEHWTQR